MLSTSAGLLLLSFFDRWTLEKGKDYFKRNRVVSIALGDREVSGIVRGGSNYQVTVKYRGASITSALCSCPMRKNCKHAAALIFAFQSSLDSGKPLQKNESQSALMLKSVPVIPMSDSNLKKAVPPSASLTDSLAKIKSEDRVPVVPQVSAVKSFSQLSSKVDCLSSKNVPLEVVNSFRCIQSALAASRSEHNQFRSSEKTFVAYILQANAENLKPVIEIKTVTVQKNGKLSPGRKTAVDELLRSGVSSSISQSDLDVAKLWRTVSRSSGDRYHYYSRHDHLDCDPELLATLLTRILKTNRCFFESANNPPLSLGPQIRGKLSWVDVPNMQFALRVCPAVETPALVCLQWPAPWYVNSSDMLCGPVALPVNSSVIEATMKMRALRAEEMKYIPLLMAEHNLAGEIDAPPEVQVHQIKSRPAVSVDMVTLRYYVNGDKGIIGSPNEQIKALVVSNQIGPEKGKVFKTEDGTLVIENHDSLSEAEIGRTLEKMGLQKLDPTAVDGAHHRANYFVPNDPSEWLTFSESHLAQIESDGWVIDDVARSLIAPLDLDDSDLEFGVSQESDWWFSLALNILVDGKSIPLLPILTNAIQRLPNAIGISAEAIDRLNKGGKFVANLPNGKLITLPFERVRAILVSLQELLTPGDSLRASILHAYDLLSDSTLSQAPLGGR